MSAFIVSNTHIATLMHFGRQHKVCAYFGNRRWDCSHPEDFDTLAQILVNQNHLSVNVRYDEGTEPFEYRPQFNMPKASLVQIIKACDCYDYQSCETEDYDDTLACKLVEAIRRQATVILPGYDAAEWAIEAPTRKAA